MKKCKKVLQDNGNIGDSISYRAIDVDLDRLRSLAKPESQDELAMDNDLEENGDLYRASMRIAMKVRRALRMAGMTQSLLAEKLNVDPAVISKSLNGKANLELKTLVRLEKVLGINIIDRSISKPSVSPIYCLEVFTETKDLHLISSVENVGHNFDQQKRYKVKYPIASQSYRMLSHENSLYKTIQATATPEVVEPIRVG